MNLISRIRSKCFPLRIDNKFLRNIKENNRKNYSSIKLNQFISEAEKEIRVPLSNFNIRYLLRDEFDLKVFTINKVNTEYISQSNHPIVGIARDIFGSDESQTQITPNIKNTKFSDNNNIGVLILLLFARVCESLPSFKSNEILIKKHYDFIEIYEMLNKALFIHNAAVVNIPPIDTIDVRNNRHHNRLNDANKISILGGDYLLSYAIVRFTNLINNPYILQLLMCAIDDYCIYQFNNIKKSAEELTIPSDNMSAIDWEEMAGYSLTKLFAYSSQIMLLLAKQSDRYQKAAFDFGYNLQLIWNLKDEIENFGDQNKSDSELNLMSAPVIFHMQNDRNFYNYLKKCVKTQKLNYSEIRRIINWGPAIGICDRYLQFYTNKAIKSLQVFPESNSKSILEKAIFV